MQTAACGFVSYFFTVNFILERADYPDMNRVLNIGLLCIGALVGILPFAGAFTESDGFSVPNFIIALINLVGWTTVGALVLVRRDLRKVVSRIAEQYGIDPRLKSFEKLVRSLLEDVERKNSAFLPNLLEKRISSKEELARTLEKTVAHSFKLLRAESAELALFDKESGMYHSSFVMGKPFRKSAQAMLSGAMDSGSEEMEISPDVLIEPLAFGGSVLGSLRVGLKRGTLPSQSDREIMHLVALHAGLAVINAQYTDELKRMKHISDESIKVKTGFLANLSHEIRAPLGIMLNAVELVLDGLCGPVNDDQLETLKMVKTNGAHLLELINDVLDYAKVESGKLQPTKVEIVVEEMLKDILSVVKTQADAKGHTLVLKPFEDVLTISCDRRHLRQMLINLLTNAIKYTPDRGVIEVWAERAPGGKIRMNVKDSGVGIEEADRSKVFSPFERIQNAYSINQVGTGLGMPLTRRLVEVNGGTIDFSSKPGQGSTFWLLFPAIEYNPAHVEDDEGAEVTVSGRGENLLLLESDEGERKMLAKHLSHAGFKVVAASSKGEALTVLREQKFNMAILDNKVVDNPEEDLLRFIRENARSSRLPVLLLSSRAFVFDIEKYLKAGVDRCLSKPIALKDLTVICRELLDGDDLTLEKKSAHRGKLINAAIASQKTRSIGS